MESVTTANLKSFLQRLGERYPGPATIYLLGGSALCLLGSPRVTLDVDYTVEVAPEDTARFQAVLAELATEMQLDLKMCPWLNSSPCHREPVSDDAPSGSSANWRSISLTRTASR